jgi:hypothetical protein
MGDDEEREMTMQRLSVGLSAPAIAWLQREAKKLGISVGDLIRRIVDEKRQPQ